MEAAGPKAYPNLPRDDLGKPDIVEPDDERQPG
jgi:hypothetical protein